MLRFFRRKKLPFWTQLVESLPVILGIVLIWRGFWHVLDLVDAYVFGGNTVWTAFGGIALGILILYLPDRSLDEIKKL